MSKIVCNSSPIIGLCIIGILQLAKKVGKISEIKPYLDMLIGENYRISKLLYLEALKIAGEEERLFE